MANHQPPPKKLRLTKQPTVETDDEDEEEGPEYNGGLGDSDEQTAQVKASEAATGFANLALKDKRRQGLYGARAFGLPSEDSDSTKIAADVSDTQYPLAGSCHALAHVNPYNQRPALSQNHLTSQQMMNTAAEKPQENSGTQVPAAQRADFQTSIPAPPSQSSVAHLPSLNQRQIDDDDLRFVPPRMHPMTGGLRLPGFGGPITRQSARLDDDRDREGNLLPAQHQPFFVTGQSRFRKLWKQAGSPYDNVGNSAEQRQSSDRKRKRTFDIMPPQPFVYTRTNNPDFNVFHGLLLYPELCFLLANEMPVRDLINLYAISTDFHVIIDSRFTTVCLGQAVAKAPESASTFHFRTYKQFCRKDPEHRIPHPDPSKAAEDVPRRIPSFRWVQMVIYREKLVHELMAVFAEYGCPLPTRCSLAIKRMWYLMDMPSNSLRIGAIHNHNLITDLDLYFAMAFFVKLDMVCNDPVAPEKRDGVRKLLLSMPDGMNTVHRVLTRQRWRKRSEMMVAWVRHTLEIPGITNNVNGPPPEQLGVPSVLGVPTREVGLLKYEYWGKKGRYRHAMYGTPPSRWQYLLRPDQLVMREAIRRGLRFHKHILRCVLYGYVNPATLESFPPRNWPRRIPEYNDEEYGINDAVGGIRALSLEEGGDPLLDLGDSSTGSRLTHVREKPHDLAGQIMAADHAFLEFMELWQTAELPKQDTDDLPNAEDLRD